MRECYRCHWIIILIVAIAIVPVNSVLATNTHIQTDNSLSGVTGLSVDATGSNYLYTLSEVNGQASGGNLFFSFSHFNIGNSDTAWFNLNTPDLENVISRVTGGSESVIDGQLKMTNIAGGNASSFFFINSAGITFGTSSSVDVPGSFYASTASNLNFSDGAQYPANIVRASTLSSADPESFGFLGNESGNLNIGSSETGQTTLAFKPGTDVAFVANHIHITNAAIKNKDATQAGLDLQLIATGAEIVNIKLDMLPDQATSGELTVQNAILDTSGSGSGRIAVRSGNFSASNSSMTANNNGNISISENDGINVLVGSELILDKAAITSDTKNAGNVSPINIKAGFLNLIDGGTISSSTFAQGNASAIIITANQLEINKKSELFTGIKSTANVGSTGNAGQIIVTVADTMRMTGDGEINSNTFAQGNAGNIQVTAAQLEIDGQFSGLSNYHPGIASLAWQGSTGNAGEIIVAVADTLSLFSDGEIVSSTFGSGNANSVMVSSKQLQIDGGDSVNFTGIGSQTMNGSTGNAGQVTVAVLDSLKLQRNGAIAASTFGQGNANAVMVSAKQIDIDPMDLPGKYLTGISSQTGRDSTGNAGEVTVTASDKLSIFYGGEISTNTFGRGNAGLVTVNAGQLLIGGLSQLEGPGINLGGSILICDDCGPGANEPGIPIPINQPNSELNLFTGIASNVLVGSVGNAGPVKVNVTDTLDLSDGGTISSSTFGEGNAGAIDIVTNQLIIRGVSGRFTGVGSTAEISSEGSAGIITVTAKNTMSLVSNGEISTNTFARGSAGLVTINAKQLEIDHSEISSNAEVGSSGKIGGIDINVKDDIRLSNEAKISIENAVSPSSINEIPSRAAINIANNSLYLKNSSISTVSKGGDSGLINIRSNSVAYLHNSPITTSVLGQFGDGGDINISSKALIMGTGFIQANAEGAGANGGKITIAEPTMIIPSSNFLLIGGSQEDFTPFSGRNVIQAVAPNGQSVPPVVGAPQLNLSGALANLNTESFGASEMNQNMCAVDTNSSLLQSGKGGQRPRARDFLLSTMQ